MRCTPSRSARLMFHREVHAGVPVNRDACDRQDGVTDGRCRRQRGPRGRERHAGCRETGVRVGERLSGRNRGGIDGVVSGAGHGGEREGRAGAELD